MDARRAACHIVASFATLVLISTATGSALGAGPAIERLSGTDRYATAVAISQATFASPPVPAVFVATGANFPDALAGGPAAATAGAPILLVTKDSIPDVVRAELQRLKPQMVIWILGGPSVVSDATMHALQAYTPGQVIRLAGSDRYATAAKIVETFFSGWTSRVFVAFGGNFPDALSGGAAAAAVDGPIVLAKTTDVPDVTVAALRKMVPTGFVLLGGTSVLGTQIEKELKALFPGLAVERWSGRDRYETSAWIAYEAFSPSDVDTIFLATGANFPDALAGCVAAAKARAPLLLTTKDCKPRNVSIVSSYLNPNRYVILGGPSVVATAAATTSCGTCFRGPSECQPMSLRATGRSRELSVYVGYCSFVYDSGLPENLGTAVLTGPGGYRYEFPRPFFDFWPLVDSTLTVPRSGTYQLTVTSHSASIGCSVGEKLAGLCGCYDGTSSASVYVR